MSDTSQKQPAVILKHFKLVVFTLFLSEFSRSLGFNLYSISLPLLAQQMAQSAILTGAAISVLGLAQACFQFPFGHYSDKHGRRGTLLISAFVYAFGALMVSFSTTIYEFIIFRAIQGIGAVFSVIQACLGDIFPTERRGAMMGWFSIVYAIGMVVGLPLGVIVSAFYGLRMPFYLGAIMAIVSAIILALFIRETHPVEFKTEVIFNPDQNLTINPETNIEPKKEPEKSTGRYMKGIIPTCIVGMLINMTQGAFFGFAPVLLEDLGYNLMGMFVFFIPGILIFFAGSIASGIISDRVGRKPPVMIGLIIGIPAAILLNFLSKTYFIPICLLMFIGISFTLPPLSALVLDLVSKEVRGNASGFYNTLTTLGNSGGVLIVGFVIQFYSIYALFGFSAILMSMCLAIGLFLMPQIKPQRKSKKTQMNDTNVASNLNLQINNESSEKLEGDSSSNIISAPQDEQF